MVLTLRPLDRVDIHKHLCLVQQVDWGAFVLLWSL